MKKLLHFASLADAGGLLQAPVLTVHVR